jgi:hypothetical protein
MIVECSIVGYRSCKYATHTCPPWGAQKRGLMKVFIVSCSCPRREDWWRFNRIKKMKHRHRSLLVILKNHVLSSSPVIISLSHYSLSLNLLSSHETDLKDVRAQLLINYRHLNFTPDNGCSHPKQYTWIPPKKWSPIRRGELSHHHRSNIYQWWDYAGQRLAEWTTTNRTWGEPLIS